MVTQQTLLFFQSMAVGALILAVYDLFRILRIAVKTPAPLVFLEDLLFCFLAAMITFFFLLGSNRGQIRMFLLIGEFLGATLYYLTIGALVLRASKAILFFLKSVVYRIFLRPVLLLLRWILRKLWQPFRFLGGKAKKIAKKWNFHLKEQWDLLYNQYKRKTAVPQDEKKEVSP